jgi:DNA-binding LacI/PurR family transcriptional regulator
MCHDDYLADNVIAVLTKLNKRVPDDISIIAPRDVINYNEPYISQITTMRINKELMGKTAGEVVISRLKNKQEGIQVLKVNQVLMDRGSVRNLGSN